MNILLFGISNVGKTAIGKIMAQKLNYDFYDIDDEVKQYYGYKNMDEFIHKNGYVVERDQKRSYIIGLVVKKDGNKVIAVPPIYYTRYCMNSLKKVSAEVIKIEIQDTPENIFNRLIFADDNDQLYHDDEYKNAHKSYYLKQIKQDISGYKVAFSKIENKIDITGRNAEEAANYIISMMNFNER
ncbi:shikimate kinase [Anaerosporobacter sp.]|uniref:shikimate kinase n=1 Tax=Anaerosporobacter sp. TaxID=1872529 RepID=UPI00286FAB33|nr:shikimate kinase [Anaerosporobacter sp.]